MSTFASDQGHWYDRDGKPVYTILGLNGKERPTTLRDARKAGYLPSVTEIQKLAPKPALDLWKAKQAVLSALTLPRLPDEADEAFCDRVLNDSKQEAIKAAEQGSALHTAIERAIQNRSIDQQWEQHVKAVLVACNGIGADLSGGEPEKSFSCQQGYGGKVDWHRDKVHQIGVVLDFKSKDRLEDGKQYAYDNHLQQLAAYERGLGMHGALLVNVFVGVKDAKVLVHVWNEQKDFAETRAKELRKFDCLLEYWIADKGYDPRQQKESLCATSS